MNKLNTHLLAMMSYCINGAPIGEKTARDFWVNSPDCKSAEQEVSHVSEYHNN